MREILRSIDPVVVSFVEALLRDAQLTFHVADRHISAVEGGISAFPRRILVLDADESEARRLLCDAGLENELSGEVKTDAANVSPKPRWRERPV
jgi:hypothetical protein